MTLNKEQKQFLQDMEITEERFSRLSGERDIQILIDIAGDYEKHKNDLLDEAHYIANKLQRCRAVHSVRSRIKDTSHLIEKIIRKWEQAIVAEKYNTINKDNYKTIITDLIGVRAIYLFKSDWQVVHTHILSKWEPTEDVVIYYRGGDELSLYKGAQNCKKEVHVSGYRSIHYLIPATKIDTQQIHCEIQTRTIFEEGWSEIDHKVRYPSFLNDPYLQSYLNIFNRLAGSADEMGSFVQELVKMITYSAHLENEKQKQTEEHNARVKQLEVKIETLFTENAEMAEVKKAYEELKQVNNQTRYPDPYLSAIRGGLSVGTMDALRHMRAITASIPNIHKYEELSNLQALKHMYTPSNGRLQLLFPELDETQEVYEVAENIVPRVPKKEDEEE